jgi:hypothetical protein
MAADLWVIYGLLALAIVAIVLVIMYAILPLYNNNPPNPSPPTSLSGGAALPAAAAAGLGAAGLGAAGLGLGLGAAGQQQALANAQAQMAANAMANPALSALASNSQAVSDQLRSGSLWQQQQLAAARMNGTLDFDPYAMPAQGLAKPAQAWKMVGPNGFIQETDGAPVNTTSDNPYLAKANPVFGTWNVGEFLPDPTKGLCGGLDGMAPTWEEVTAASPYISDPRLVLQAAAAANYFYGPLEHLPKTSSSDLRPIPPVGNVPVAFNGTNGTTVDDILAYNAGYYNFAASPPNFA